MIQKKTISVHTEKGKTMKELEIDFRTNYKGADFNGKIIHKCKDKADLMTVQRMIWDYLQNYIDKAEENNG